MTAGDQRQNRAPYFILLLSLISLLLVVSVLDANEPTGLGLLMTLVLFAGINASGEDRRHRSVAFALAIPWLLLRWLGPLSGIDGVETVTTLVFLAFIVFVTGVILRHVLKASTTVDLNTICGAISVYLLAAVIWAVLYSLIEGWSPGSIALPGTAAAPSFQQFVYFSLTTITTLGYGDIQPVAPLTGMLAVLEATAGIFYVAVLVARLVSVYRSDR